MAQKLVHCDSASLNAKQFDKKDGNPAHLSLGGSHALT
jgi:hypothetical protein